MLRKRGIKNEGNFCFLNSIMNCLANSIDFREPSDCEFQKYLFLTLQYIHECEETKNLYLFWVELRRRQPQLFQEQPDKQQPQDAYETLLYLLTESNLLDRFTILTNNPYCQIKEYKNIVYLHKNWADESVYYVWENKIKFQNLRLLLNLDEESELHLYKMIPDIDARIEWHKDEPFDFDSFTYHIEPQPLDYELLIEVILQFVDNDVTITLLRQRVLFLKEFQIKKSELYKKLRSLLDNTKIKFDVYGYQGYIEDNDEEWELISPLYLVFRTIDHEQFQWCKQLNVPKQAINYQYKLQFDQPIIIDNPSDILILVLQRVELIKNQNLYILRENLRVNKRTYQLKSVCCHVGDAQNGHYLSYLKFGNQWEMWDDETIELRNIDYQCMSSSYILFYKIE